MLGHQLALRARAKRFNSFEHGREAMMRWTWVLLLSLASVPALVRASDCGSDKAVAHAQAGIDAALQSMAAEPKRYTERLDAQLKAKALAMGWSTAQQSAVRSSVFASDAQQALAEEKMPHVIALSQAVLASSGPAPVLSKCAAAQQVKSLGKQLSLLYRRQYEEASRAIDRIDGVAE